MRRKRRMKPWAWFELLREIKLEALKLGVLPRDYFELIYNLGETQEPNFILY